MSTGVVVSLPTSAPVPVQNPPMRKGPKPKGTLSFYAARRKRESHRLMERQQRREVDEDVPCGVREVVARQAKLLAEAFAQLGVGERWKVVSLVQDLATKK